jgi:hypothetical protein
MMHHLENLVNVYDRVEAYEVCGEELREAYVGLKRMRQACSFSPPSRHPGRRGLLKHVTLQM